MSRYLGIIKKVSSGMIGTNISIITKTSIHEETIKRWQEDFPNCENIIIPYESSNVDDFFKDFEDFSPKTKEDKLIAEQMYRDLMNENDSE